MQPVCISNENKDLNHFDLSQSLIREDQIITTKQLSYHRALSPYIYRRRCSAIGLWLYKYASPGARSR